ncbi:histidine phosphatase family protein [Sporichthya polymorpha]|uniref:histidine phosphatase family protein n=1 Tax=Sporichthya polymorpha TaxID=35751 RepID=UPI0012EC68C0|nr:histidine phosphatase family protein [Sporichthya polymorpha]
MPTRLRRSTSEAGISDEPKPGGLEVAPQGELVLVRHGLPERGLTGPDRSDPGLSERGRAEARAVADFLAAEHFDAIYSSPLKRAMETAAPFAADRGIEVVPLDGLAEFDKHSDEYLFFEDLQKAGDPRYKACLRGDLSAWNTDYPAFKAEVMEAITEITTKHAGQRVLAFSHGGALNTILGAVLGLDRMWFFYPKHTGICRVAVDHHRNRMRIITLNEFSHLRALD